MNFFDSTEVWTKDLALAKQVFYHLIHLSYTARSSSLVIFWIRVSLSCPAAWGPQFSYPCFLHSWMTDTCCHAQYLLIEVESPELFPRLASNPDPPNLHLLTSRITDVSHCHPAQCVYSTHLCVWFTSCHLSPHLSCLMGRCSVLPSSATRWSW
jgi:hypothetical protein